MAKKKTKVLYANDATESVFLLLKIRMPWLLVGLLLSLATAAFVSQFEEILSLDPRVAFFMPLIIYISDAVGTQTAVIYIRNLTGRQAKFNTYIIKELALGMMMGTIFGTITGLITYFWLDSANLSVAVGLAMVMSISCATLISLAISSTLNRLKTDPATSTDPLLTVVQNIVSLMIYFYVVSLLVS